MMLLLIEIRSELEMSKGRPVGVAGWMVAVGFPKTERSVRFTTKTFSVQVPETAIEFGPTAGKLAKAALMLVNAPGVAPVQSTVTSAANA
jgi:hypothetical protein